MELLDWLFVILLSLAIFAAIFLVISLVGWIADSQKLNSVTAINPNKKQRRAWLQYRLELTNQISKKRNHALFAVIFAAVFAGGSFYIQYHQSTSLTAKDSENVVQGYFILQELEKQLTELPTSGNEKKAQATIYELYSRLFSYGSNVPEPRLGKEEKLVLKQLYTRMKQLGINLAGLSITQLKTEDVNTGYLNDIKRTQLAQEKVFEHFKVDKAALEQE